MQHKVLSLDTKQIKSLLDPEKFSVRGILSRCFFGWSKKNSLLYCVETVCSQKTNTQRTLRNRTPDSSAGALQWDRRSEARPPAALHRSSSVQFASERVPAPLIDRGSGVVEPSDKKHSQFSWHALRLFFLYKWKKETDFLPIMQLKQLFGCVLREFPVSFLFASS